MPTDDPISAAGKPDPASDAVRGRTPDLANLVPPPQADQQVTTDPFHSVKGEHFPPDASSRDVPEPIPGYELLEPLGKGGMGVVWKARQVRLNRVVALKMILGGSSIGPKELIRFLAEAEAVAAVKHPNVVQVYEYGEHEGRPFLAMEYLPGGSLADRLGAKPSRDAGNSSLDPRAAAQLIGKLAEAVQSAHEQGIVHRDLKPANVLFDEHGQPKVTDFGLAKKSGGSDLTATQAVMGTPAYMAPEQAKGETRFVGPAADVYSLGVILYECLTGSRPFHAADPIALLRKVAEQEPERPGKRVLGLPRDVELICLKCLAKEPTERYPTARALGDDLGRFTAGKPVSVRAAGRIERGVKWARRNPILAGLYATAATAVVLLAIGGVIAWLWRDAVVASREADTQRANAENLLGISQAAEQDATRARTEAEKARDAEKIARAEVEVARKRLAMFEYGRTMQVAHQEWRENNIPLALDLINSTKPEFRGWEWDYVNRLCHSDVFTFAKPGDGAIAASFSPDGLRVITVTDIKHLNKYKYYSVKVWNATTDTEICALKHTDFVTAAALSADGRKVVTVSGSNTAKVWDVRTGTELLSVKKDTNQAIRAVSFSPDGAAILVRGGEGIVKVWNATTGTDLVTLKAPLANALLGLDASRVVTCSADEPAKVWDTTTGTELIALKGRTGYIASVSFSPDGTRVVTTGHDRHDPTAKIWDLKTGAHLLTLTGHSSKFVEIASFSPDGLRVVTGSGDGTSKVWDARSGAELFTLRGHTDHVKSASFSPDGTRIATLCNGGTVKVWDAATGADAVIINQNARLPFQFNSAAFNSNGSRVLTRIVGSKAMVWDVATGVGILGFATGAQVAGKGPNEFEHDMDGMSASFSPDGTRIAAGSSRGTAKVWDATTGAELLHLRGHTDVVYSTSFNRDASRLVTGGGTAKVWDVFTGIELLTLQGHKGVKTASFSPDGARVVTGASDGTAKIWDATTGAEIVTLSGHALRHGTRSASFSPDGLRVVTGNSDKTAKVWDANTGAELFTLRGHTDVVTAAAFSPNGLRIVTGSRDLTARVWDATTGAELLSLKGHYNNVCSASFSSDGSQVLTGSADGTARIWDARPVKQQALPFESVRSLAEIQQLSPPGAILTSVMFSRDGKHAVVGGFDKVARLWDIGVRKELKVFKGHAAEVWSVALSSDGKTALTGGQDKTIRFWDTTSGQERHRFTASATFSCVRYSPDGSLAAATNWDGKVRLWKMPDAVPQGEFAYDTPTLDLAFTPDGKRFVLGTAAGRVLICDSATGKVLRTLLGHSRTVHGVAVVDGGKRVLSASHDLTIRLWNVETGLEDRVFRGHTGFVHEVRMLPDGKRFVSGGEDKTLRLWDLETGRELARATAGGGVRGLSVTPDGKMCLTAVMDGTLRLWGLPPGK